MNLNIFLYYNRRVRLRVDFQIFGFQSRQNYSLFVMEQEIIQEFQFDDPDRQQLFQTLLSNITRLPTPYTEADLKVDLVLRMKIPSEPYDVKSKQPHFSTLFRNTPPIYEEIYQLVQEYIDYLVENNQQNRDIHNPTTRAFTSINDIYPAVTKKRKIDLDLDDPIEQSVNTVMDIDCNYRFQKKIDLFTLRCNMIMLVLSKLCGFRVRAFIMENQLESKKNDGKLSVYFLMSLTNQNLIKMADRYKIKKEIDMGTFDFSVNDPMDSKDRPIKLNSFFKSQKCKGFNDSIKRLNRDLGLSNKSFLDQIIDDVQLTQTQIEKFQNYFQELQYEVHRIFPPIQLKTPIPQKIGTTENFMQYKTRQLISQTNPNSKQSLNKLEFGDPYTQTNKSQIKGLNTLTKHEKYYLYNINRHKINKGCEQYMLTLKKRKYILNKIIALNKKYGYKVFEYNDSFVEFTLPSKHKPFFQKLKHLLQYQWYEITPYGEISLFTSMERIKLAYLIIQEKFKVENLSKIGAEIYAINSQYQKFGELTSEFNKNYGQEDAQPHPIKITPLCQAWHPFLPFFTNIRKVRDYLGDDYTLQLAFKIHLITYLLIILGLGIGLQVAIQVYFVTNSQKQYILEISQLFLLSLSFTLFIETWQQKQVAFINNYLEEHESSDIRAAYQGPYVRSIIDDNLNTFRLREDFKDFFKKALALLAIGGMLVAEAFYFYFIRRLIVSNFASFPSFFTYSTSHLFFYAVFFVTNRLFYQAVGRHILNKLAFMINFAKISNHQEAKRKYNDYFLFGIEMVGPFFFYIFEKFNGSTCYAVSCRVELVNYIISRYIINASIHSLLNVGIAFKLAFQYYKRSIIIGELEVESKDIQQTFQYQLSRLLAKIRFQSQKSEMEHSIRQQRSNLLFFSIFFIYFPFCTLFSLGGFLFSYIVYRIDTIFVRRRPIPISSTMWRYTEMIRRMYFMSMMLNCWAVIFNSNFMEYYFISTYNIFVTTITEENMLTFKLFSAVFLFVFFLILTKTFRILLRMFTNSNLVQKRKMNKFKEFLNKVRGRPGYTQTLALNIPLKSIFRTFSIESVIEYKKNKFNFLKRKLRPQEPVVVQYAEELVQLTMKKTVSNLKTLNRSFVNSQSAHEKFKGSKSGRLKK